MSFRVALILTFALCVPFPEVLSLPKVCRDDWKPQKNYFNLTQYLPLYAGSAAMAKKLEGTVFELSSKETGLDIKIYSRDNIDHKCLTGEWLQPMHRSKAILSSKMKGPELCDADYTPNAMKISSGYLGANLAFIRTCSEDGDRLEFIIISCNLYHKCASFSYKTFTESYVLLENDTFTFHEVQRNLQMYSGYLTRDFLRDPGKHQIKFCPLLWQYEMVNEKQSLVFIIVLLIIISIVGVTILCKHYARERVFPIV